MREEFEVELKEYQHEYLTKMVENFDLPDLGKAVRCLIDYAIDEAELEADISISNAAIPASQVSERNIRSS